MGVINRIKQSGGGSASIATTPVPFAEAYVARLAHLGLAEGSSTSFTTVALPTGYNLEVRKLEMFTTSQTHARLDNVNLSGERIYLYKIGNFSLDFIEAFGGPILTKDFWSASIVTLTGAGAPADYHIWLYGKLVKE